MKLPAHIGPVGYGRFLMAVTGFGGLLYGIDIGIIAAALLYLSKTISLTVAQTSLIVAAVLGGSMVSSLVAGLLADWLGRRRMMIAAAVLFLASVLLIVFSQGFTLLFAGRVLQGMSGGVIAVVIPLYLAECLGAHVRGRGTAIFQWMLTLGIVIASVAGMFYTRAAENAIRAAQGNPTLIRLAEDHAWRSMFFVMLYPGVIFLLGTLALVETPRWLMRRGRPQQALASLHRLVPPAEANLQMAEMQATEPQPGKSTEMGTLLRRKYVIPFLLACVVLVCNQATGINSVLGFLVVILKQAGMSAANATTADVVVKMIHCLATVVAVVLVESKGRRFLLKLGTGGIVLSLVATSLLFHSFESLRTDLSSRLQTTVSQNSLHADLSPTFSASARPAAMTVLYSYGEKGGQRVVTVTSSDANRTISIVPGASDAGSPLIIRHAFYGPVARRISGLTIAVCLGLFVSFFSLGPGVVVWLTLSELMPTRIRSTGMGIALLLNQGVSTLIAAVFLPVVGNYGFTAIFIAWAACAALYFTVATLFLPETKGKTLEEIEAQFEAPRVSRTLRA